MRIVYNIGIRTYYFLVLIVSIWNPKAAKWISGRKKWRADLKGKFKHDDNVVWCHCASLGEFEQGRPVIEKIHKENKDYKILLTFFSPSGYEKRKNFPLVDHVSYLPFDSRKNARDFLALVPVKKAIFIKYEFWYHMLYALKMNKIPTYLISGHFRPNQLFFRWYGTWYRKMLNSFTHIFVQNESSSELLKQFGFDENTVAGDTRFDRVLSIAETNNKWNSLKEFSNSRPLFIAGSTWELDEKILQAIYLKYNELIHLIIAPHEPNKKSLDRLVSLFPDSVLYSTLDADTIIKNSIIIVDTIGHLSSLYQYGDIAYIGGGFGKGIHNILEASAAGLPVIFGPNYKNFQEARDLVELEGAFSIKNINEGIEIFEALLNDENDLSTKKDLVKKYTIGKKGATNFILERIFG